VIWVVRYVIWRISGGRSAAHLVPDDARTYHGRIHALAAAGGGGADDAAAAAARAADAQWDVVVIGGGVVGTAMARSMGLQGRRTLLLERDLREPDRIVGELMQPGGVRVLERLGMG